MGLAPLLAVCCGYFMVILDVTIVNVAVPAIGRELGASLTDLQWIVDGYTVAFAGLLLSAARSATAGATAGCSASGVALFTVSSLGCAVAANALVLTAFRLLEGCGAALLVPGSLALLQQVYRTPSARARAFGLWGAIAGMAATAGPLVGGVLTTTVGWRWVFVINLPVGVLCLVLTMATVAPSPRDAGRVIDSLGQAAVVVTVAAVIAALNEAGRQGIGGPAVIGGVLVAVVAAGVLVLRERFGAHPPLPLPMVRSRPVSGGTAIGFLFNFGFYGMIFAASVYFQQHLNLSAALAGLALLPAMAVTMVASALSGKLSDRFPHRRLMLIGLAHRVRRPGALGGGRGSRELPGPRRRHDRLRLRHVVHPHRGDLHGDERRPRGLRGHGVGGAQHGAADGVGGGGRDQRIAHRAGGPARGRHDVHGRRRRRIPPRRGPHRALRPAVAAPAEDRREGCTRAPLTAVPSRSRRSPATGR